MPDLPFLRGSFTEGLSSAAVNWQGFYVGGQVSYGSVTSKVAPDANSDLQANRPSTPPTGVAYNWLSLPSAHATADRLRRLLSDTIRNGKTSSSASKAITSMTASARSRIR